MFVRHERRVHQDSSFTPKYSTELICTVRPLMCRKTQNINHMNY